MSFDIYGQHLRSGHCEVHPDVHECYPCSICMADFGRNRRAKAEEDRYYREMEEKYYAELAGCEEYDSWGKP